MDLERAYSETASTPSIVAIKRRIFSRLASNTATIFATSSAGEASASIVAYCAIEQALLVAWLWKESIAFATSLGAARYPILQPVIAYVFDTPLTVIVKSFIRSLI